MPLRADATDGQLEKRYNVWHAECLHAGYSRYMASIGAGRLLAREFAAASVAARVQELEECVGFLRGQLDIAAESEPLRAQHAANRERELQVALADARRLDWLEQDVRCEKLSLSDSPDHDHERFSFYV